MDFIHLKWSDVIGHIHLSMSSSSSSYVTITIIIKEKILYFQNSTVQGISGTGSLRIGAAFFVRHTYIVFLHQIHY